MSYSFLARRRRAVTQETVMVNEGATTLDVGLLREARAALERNDGWVGNDAFVVRSLAGEINQWARADQTVWIDANGTSLRIRTDNLVERTRERRKAAQLKGKKLLWEHITPKQRYQLQTGGYFEVRGGITGRVYRIYHGTMQNIVDTRTGKGWCMVFAADLVEGDVMLGQKLAIELEEDKFVRTAHPFTMGVNLMELLGRFAAAQWAGMDCAFEGTDGSA